MLPTGDDGNSAEAIASPKRAGDGASPVAGPPSEILPEPLPEPALRAVVGAAGPRP
jgi:hypothetical protein